MQIDDAPLVGIEDGVIVRFHIKAFKNEAKTKAEGRPVFENREMVEITFSGDNKTVVNQIVKEHHRNRFPRSYKAFKEGTQIAANGFPIEKWEVLDPATKATLKYMNVFTIEQLAELHDGVLPNIGMGAHEMREKARKWVGANKVDENTAKLQAQIDELKSQLQNKPGADESDGEERRSKKRGRPAKEETVEEEKPMGTWGQEYVPASESADELPPHMQAGE